MLLTIRLDAAVEVSPVIAEIIFVAPPDTVMVSASANATVVILTTDWF